MACIASQTQANQSRASSSSPDHLSILADDKADDDVWSKGVQSQALGLRAFLAASGEGDGLHCFVAHDAPAAAAAPQAAAEASRAPAAGRMMKLFHGTSWENAVSIQAHGFKASAQGRLGPGVYLSREDKARRFALDVTRHGGSDGGLLTVLVRITNPKFVRGDDEQGRWRQEGYDACRTEYTSMSQAMEWVIASQRQITKIVCVERIPLSAGAGKPLSAGESVPPPLAPQPAETRVGKSGRPRARHILQYSKAELRGMGWNGQQYFSRSQDRMAPYVSDMDSDSDYSYDDLSNIPEHLLPQTWREEPAPPPRPAPAPAAAAALPREAKPQRLETSAVSNLRRPTQPSSSAGAGTGGASGGGSAGSEGAAQSVQGVRGKCNHCGRDARLKCAGCKRAVYCRGECQREDWQRHKVACKDLPKAVEEAEAAMGRPLSSFTCKHWGAMTFGLSEAEAARGEVQEEKAAQDVCYQAQEVAEASPEKLRLVMRALKMFPLSTEAWGMLGFYYASELPDNLQDLEMARRMYKNAIGSARKLNPTWGEDRQKKLEWSTMHPRAYMRSLLGLAILMERMGDSAEAIRIAKLLLKWNPSDNQGVRGLVCNWMLAVGDIEGCTHLFRKYSAETVVELAYADVMIQWQRWHKSEVLEAEAQRALATALRTNPYVPDLLLSDEVDQQKLASVTVGGPTEALSYVQKAHTLWKGSPACREWLGAQRRWGGKVPDEASLIKLLRKERQVQMECRRWQMEGSASEDAIFLATQARKHCFGGGLPGFAWPAQLDRRHAAGEPILLHMQGMQT
jgi:tetratricopeptide (TPR) repeat protein